MAAIWKTSYDILEWKICWNKDHNMYTVCADLRDYNSHSWLEVFTKQCLVLLEDVEIFQ